MSSQSLSSRFATRVDLHQSPSYSRLMQKIGWQTEGLPNQAIYYRQLGYFVVAKTQRPKVIDPELINSFRKKHHTITTYVEGPLASTPYAYGFDSEPFAHSATSLVDLSLTSSKLLSSFGQKTRYNITHYQKLARLKIKSIPLPKLKNEIVNQFLDLHHNWSRRKNVVGYSKELLLAAITSFGQNSHLHLAYLNNDLVSTLLTLTNNHVATYYAAFSNTIGYSEHAPTLLTYQAMLTAKDSGSDIFDFGGIYDQRYPKMYKKWQGFTKFKSGFKPTPIYYPLTKLLLFW